MARWKARRGRSWLALCWALGILGCDGAEPAAGGTDAATDVERSVGHDATSENAANPPSGRGVRAGNGGTTAAGRAGNGGTMGESGRAGNGGTMDAGDDATRGTLGAGGGSGTTGAGGRPAGDAGLGDAADRSSGGAAGRGTRDASTPLDAGSHALPDADVDASGSSASAGGGGNFDSSDDAPPTPTTAYFPDIDFPVPGRVESFVYDRTRRAFFGVFWDLDYNASFQFARVRYDGANWAVDVAPLLAPRAVTFSPDHRELFVTTTDCILAHVDPDTLRVNRSEPLSPCAYQSFGPIYTMADGQVLYVDTAGWSMMWQYPELTRVSAPSLYYPPLGIVAPDGSRLIWAQEPTISGEHGIYSYDAASDQFTAFKTVTDDYYLANLLAISNQGRRFLHESDVYDADFRYLGTLAGESAWAIGVSGNGSVAVGYQRQAQTLQVHDIRASAQSYPPIATMPFPSSQYGEGNRIFVDDSGSVAFIFTIRTLDPITLASDFHFVVRNLPPLRAQGR